MSDFIREVDEDYRRERILGFLTRFQVPLAILVVAIIVGAGAWRFYKDRQTAAAEADNVRYAAANRDPRHFECPNDINLERKNAGSHLGFGSGIHHCLGAPLARRELYWGFKAFVDNVKDFELSAGNTFRHHPNFCLRPMKELHIEFEKEA